MIGITSSEKERYEALANENLTVIPWNEQSFIHITDDRETISHALYRFANECQLIGLELEMDGIPEKIRITKKTVGESISAMRRQQSDLLDLGKLFTVLKPVLNHAILVKVEPFRYTNLHKAKMIIGEYQYISAFHDFNVLYPVKITAERYKKSNYTNIHVIITVGKIALSDISEKIERSVAYTGVQPPFTDSESLFSEDASFVINIQQFVKLFNKSEGIILKNMPDGLLNEEQKLIKSSILRADAEKIEKRMEKYK